MLVSQTSLNDYNKVAARKSHPEYNQSMQCNLKMAQFENNLPESYNAKGSPQSILDSLLCVRKAGAITGCSFVTETYKLICVVKMIEVE